MLKLGSAVTYTYCVVTCMVAAVLIREGEASTNYRSLAILRMFLSYLVVSSFVVCINNPFQAKLNFLFN